MTTTKQFPKDTSGNLFDYLRSKKRVPSDAQLGKRLSVPATAISRIRNGKLPVGPTMILRVYDEFGLSIPKIRALIAGM